MNIYATYLNTFIHHIHKYLNNILDLNKTYFLIILFPKIKVTYIYISVVVVYIIAYSVYILKISQGIYVRPHKPRPHLP